MGNTAPVCRGTTDTRSEKGSQQKIGGIGHNSSTSLLYHIVIRYGLSQTGGEMNTQRAAQV